MSAFSQALALESASDLPILRDRNQQPIVDKDGNLIYTVTSKDICEYASIVAYKVGYNLANGLALDPNQSPLQLV